MVASSPEGLLQHLKSNFLPSGKRVRGKLPPSPDLAPVWCGPCGGMVPFPRKRWHQGSPWQEGRGDGPCTPFVHPPLSLPQEATCCGGRAWGLPAQQACGSCSKPLGRGLTSSRLCETPGGFFTSSNGRVGVGEASPKVPTSACTGPGPALPPTCSPSPPPPTDSQEDTASVNNSWKAVQARSGAFF